MSEPRVPIQRLPHGADLPLPAYATEGSAGLDLLAAVADDIVLAPGARALVPCGFALALPPGVEAQVRPRSGLALKHGITVLNAPGTIDSDYRGEVGAILVNLGQAPFTVTRGSRIAQMVIASHHRVALAPAEALAPSARGAGGFGSTGVEREVRSNQSPASAAPPTLTLPHKGGGNIGPGAPSTPSPSMGEGRGGGDLRYPDAES